MEVLTIDYTAANAPTLFCQSLRETGFAVLHNHPIPFAIIEQAYAQWRDFFASEKKHDYLYQKPSQNGYFPLGTESAKNNDVYDLKEFYHYYPWGKVPPEVAVISNKVYLQLTNLASELLQWIENFLPEAIAKQLSIPLSKMIENAPNTMLRILHYPMLNATTKPGVVRAAAHEDINLITLLPAATAPGLEVKDRMGNWHAVSCDPGNIVVNVADMLQLCTQNYYRSTTHRVVNPINQEENCSRYSMPLFLHAHEETLLSATQTAKEYLHERLRAIGIY